MGSSSQFPSSRSVYVITGRAATEPARNLHNEVDHSRLSLDERRRKCGDVLNITVRSNGNMPGRNLHEFAVEILLDLALVLEVLSQFSLCDTSLRSHPTREQTKEDA